MHHLAGDAGRGPQPDLVQVAVEELGAAGHVRARELGAVVMALVAGMADVARVMKQRADDAQDGPRRPQAFGLGHRQLVPLDQPAEGERHVQRVLDVVVDRIAAQVTRRAAAEKVVEVLEGAAQHAQLHAGIKAREAVVYDLPDRLPVGHRHGVGHVVVAAPVTQHQHAGLGSDCFHGISLWDRRRARHRRGVVL